MIKVDTVDGPMEVDFKKMELYVQRGDLCCPMVQTGGGCSEQWTATCPMTGREYNLMRGTATNQLYIFSGGYRLGETKYPLEE